MILVLKDKRQFRVDEEKAREIIAIIQNKEQGEDTEIKSKKNKIKKEDVDYLIDGDYAYTRDGLFNYKRNKPKTYYKVFHSNIQTDFITIDEDDIDRAIKAFLHKKPFSYKGGIINIVKILPNINRSLGWNDDYIPTGEFIREAEKYNIEAEGNIQKRIENITKGVELKQLN